MEEKMKSKYQKRKKILEWIKKHRCYPYYGYGYRNGKKAVVPMHCGKCGKHGEIIRN